LPQTASAQGHVQDHHQHESQGHSDDPDIRVSSGLKLGDQFLDHHVDHRPGREGQQIGNRRVLLHIAVAARVQEDHAGKLPGVIQTTPGLLGFVDGLWHGCTSLEKGSHS
jgi:hypothetical protein